MSFEWLSTATQKDLDRFKSICNQLLSRTYVVRTVYQPGVGRVNNPDYVFLSAHFEAIQEYLAFLDWDLRKDDLNGYYYVLNTDRALLYERIDRRVDLMMEQGLVEEVKALKDMGCRRGHTSMQGLGYKEILDYLEGRCSLDEAVYVLKRDTRHFAKRQLTWFKRERDVRFLNLPDFGGDVSNVLKQILEDCAKQGIVLQ